MKILDVHTLTETIRQHQAAGRTVVHCHGVFDPLHVGHIRHFMDARRFGEILVVTVTPDRFVNKGPHRPVFGEQLRAEAVAALEAVNYVAINEWPTAVETILRLRPNIFVKGSEFRSGRDLTGAIALEEQAIQSVGGRLEFTDDLVFSSSNLVNRHLSVFPSAVTDYLSEFSQRFSTSNILNCLQACPPFQVLVLGETIVEEYHYVEAIGKSSKEPMLVVKSLSQDRFVSGAPSVANHASSFTNHVRLISQLGEENSQEDFVRKKLAPSAQAEYLYRPKSPTIVKKRYIENYFSSKMFEVYDINDALPTEEESRSLVERLEGTLGQFDLVVVSDAGHGFFTPEVIDLVCRESRFLALNTQTDAGNLGFNLISKYPRADYISLAENEVRLESRDRRGELRPMLEKLAEKMHCERIVVTRGSRGCLGFSQTEGFVEVPAFATHVVDRTGAGDAFFAVTSLCAVQQTPIEILAFIGNVVGAEMVSIMGNPEPVDRVRLLRHIEHLLK